MRTILKQMAIKFSLPLLATALLVSCQTAAKETVTKGKRYEYANILNIEHTPDSLSRNIGCFTDAGSWMGFTIPQKDKWVNGFCGPFSINNRIWFAKSVMEVSVENDDCREYKPDSLSYFPGETYLKSSSSKATIEQRLNFIDASTALLKVHSDHKASFIFKGNNWNKDITLKVDQNTLTAYHPSGEIVLLTFCPEVNLSFDGTNYEARTPEDHNAYATISFFTSEKELLAGKQRCLNILNDPSGSLKSNHQRWESYLKKALRPDMKPEYSRIAVKSVVTLISNWRTHRGALLHEGVIPSHAVGYFVGFWAWDSWRFSAILAKFAPELAKNNIRAMFDYQQPDGMVIDCIYTDATENNKRDSKPPLACWAVDEIFTHTQDTAFVKEMYPQLLAYYKWWYQKRDHNRNGMCEFGSCDGTIEAAAWESGMDNAIRFDNATMLKNAEDAWSFNQESVDLNAYLALECKLLKKFSHLVGSTFDGPDYSEKVADYFFSKRINFFCDRRLPGGSYIEEPGCEGYTAFWTKIATQEQMDKALVLLKDTAKFSTYIPFPTIAADNPKYDPKGYWRGPIWLDQTYFAIKGLRNYGYSKEADQYTCQVFDRLKGLKEDAPIHENYGTHTGELLKAPHFSWSAAHLLMLYEDYGK